MKAGDLVLIEWGDAHSSTGWVSIEDAVKAHKPEHCFSTGWVLKTDHAGTSLYGSINGTSEDGYDIGERIFIPGGMIQKVIVLKKGKKPSTP